MKILLVADNPKTAIDRLCRFIKRRLDCDEDTVDILCLHPKRPEPRAVDFVKERLNDYDLISWQYWRSWEKAREILGRETPRPSILTHHNPYDVLKGDWNWFHDEVVVFNESQRSDLGYGLIIRHGVDEGLFHFTDEPLSQRTIGLCAARIENNKGVFEIAEVAKALDIPFVVMGRISNSRYWKDVKRLGAKVEFFQDVRDSEQSKVYAKMGVYVCNSRDNFESGPMPPMEAALCGVPVISRRVGMLPEIWEHDRHCLFFEGQVGMRSSILKVFCRRIGDRLRREAYRVVIASHTSRKFVEEYKALFRKVLA